MGLPCFDLHVPNVTGVGDIVRSLRTALGITQDRLAELSGLERNVIVKIEGGANKASSDKTRTALARGFNLNRETMVAVLEGRTPVDRAAEVAGVGRILKAITSGASKERRTTRDDPYQHRAQFVILARAREGGADEGVIAAMMMEFCEGGDPGPEYWRRRYGELKAEKKLVESVVAGDALPAPAVDPSSSEVLAKRKKRR